MSSRTSKLMQYTENTPTKLASSLRGCLERAPLYFMVIDK
jgi:hypothetical protein